MPSATTIGDSSLEGAGGFSTTLGFWWHIRFPDEVVQHTLQFKTNNNNGMLMLINVLEFVMVIINYCAALMLFGYLLSQTIPILLSSTSLTTLLLCLGHSTRTSNQKLGKCFLVSFVHC
jgi:hypothetical protein